MTIKDIKKVKHPISVLAEPAGYMPDLFLSLVAENSSKAAFYGDNHKLTKALKLFIALKS